MGGLGQHKSNGYCVTCGVALVPIGQVLASHKVRYNPVIDYTRVLGWTGVASNRKNADSETDAVSEVARLNEVVELQKNELRRLRRLLGHGLQLP
jgi:hypothetical protein